MLAERGVSQGEGRLNCILAGKSSSCQKAAEPLQKKQINRKEADMYVYRFPGFCCVALLSLLLLLLLLCHIFQSIFTGLSFID